jgi:hypothetical protein
MMSLAIDIQRDTCMALQYSPPAPDVKAAGIRSSPLPPTRSISTPSELDRFSCQDSCVNALVRESALHRSTRETMLGDTVPVPSG